MYLQHSCSQIPNPQIHMELQQCKMQFRVSSQFLANSLKKWCWQFVGKGHKEKACTANKVREDSTFLVEI